MIETGVRSSVEIKRKFLLEFVWWLITALVTLLIILPVIQNSRDYPFLFSNALSGPKICSPNFIETFDFGPVYLAIYFFLYFN